MPGGRRPTPPEVKKVTGNPGLRPIPKVKKDPRGVGDPYVGMSPESKEVWIETADEWALTLCRSDRKALRIFCEAWAEALEAIEALDVEGKILTSSKTNQRYRNPWLNVLENRRDLCRKMLTEFGGSPATRGKIADLSGDEDEDGEFFSRGSMN